MRGFFASLRMTAFIEMLGPARTMYATEVSTIDGHPRYIIATWMICNL